MRNLLNLEFDILLFGDGTSILQDADKRLQELVGITHFNCSFWFGDMDQRRVLRSMRR